MERRYVRQYENFENPIPDFNSSGLPEEKVKVDGEIINTEVSNIKNGFKLDDIILIGILIMLLNEEEKDTSTIILLALLFLSEYIF
jgi:hypothetical protein